VDDRWLRRDGRDLLDFSSNDYLGLTRDPEVGQAVAKALEAHGTGAGASRLITGDHPDYSDLEAQLAALKGMGELVFDADRGRGF